MKKEVLESISTTWKYRLRISQANRKKCYFAESICLWRFFLELTRLIFLTQNVNYSQIKPITFPLFLTYSNSLSCTIGQHAFNKTIRRSKTLSYRTWEKVKQEQQRIEHTYTFFLFYSFRYSQIIYLLIKTPKIDDVLVKDILF